MKISLKMLLLTLVSFLFLIIGVIFSMYFYFHRYYEPQKIARTIDSINEFTDSYEKLNWTDVQLYTEVSRFMTNQNATLSIMSNVSLMLTATATVNEAEIDISAPALRAVELKDSLTLNDASLPTYSAGTTTSINGTYVLYPMGNAISLSVADTKQKDGVDYIISTIPYTKFHQVVFSKEFKLKNGETKTLLANISLQSVDEVMDFFIGIFPYLIGAVLLLSLFMVMVYSKLIIKPIIHITNISNRMANMELGITLDFHRKDELGALSVSLNTLSSNLKTALEELSTANHQLKNDYEQELRQEQARKEFVANVSHELKSPLGIIKSYTEGIGDGIKTEKRDYYVEVILEEVNRMDQMIYEMLEISKFDAGAVIYHKSPADLRILVNKSVQNFREKAAKRGVLIQVRGEFRMVSIDSGKIERVFHNFINNAVKYCIPDTTITIVGVSENGAQTIYINNECEPYTEDVLEKLWNRFYKADTSHSRKTDGTGLGLSIAKSILEGHGCTYGVKTTDSGISFYFTLKLHNEALP